MRWTAESMTIAAALSLIPLAGVYLFAAGFRNLRRALSSEYWPKAPGVVLDATAAADHSTRGSSDGAMVTVHYEVRGRPYTTQKIRFGQIERSGSSPDSELIRLMYAPGRRVAVSYLPANPAMAVIEPGFHLQTLAVPGAAVALILAGILFLVLYIRSHVVDLPLGPVLRLFPLILLGMGIVIGAAGLSSLSRAWASRNWPRAEGVITFGRVDDSRSVTRDEKGNLVHNTTFGARLVYRYEIKGQIYYSNVRRFGQISAASTAWAEEVAARYPMGKPVSVAYDPKEPARAVLEPGVGRETWLIPGAGAALSLFGLAVAYVMR